MRWVASGAALVLCGCAYTVQLTSDAPGARVEGADAFASSLPTEVRVPWGPWVRRRVTISAPSYRPLEMDLGFRTVRAGDLSRASFLAPWTPRRQTLDVVLVPEHGLSGTWTGRTEGVVP